MNRERELLKKVISRDNKGDFLFSYDLYKEIKEFLAQPEHVTDVGYMVERINWLEDQLKQIEQDSPPKREPLSDGDTADMWHSNKKATHADSYWAGVYDAEKAHGITGVDDE